MSWMRDRGFTRRHGSRRGGRPRQGLGLARGNLERTGEISTHCCLINDSFAYASPRQRKRHDTEGDEATSQKPEGCTGADAAGQQGADCSPQHQQDLANAKTGTP